MNIRYKCFGCGTPFNGEKKEQEELMKMHAASGSPHDQIRVDES